MQTFKPCLGKNACRDSEDLCLACGRPLHEVARTREIIDQLAEFVIASGYANVEEFTAYVARKVVKKVEHQRK
jgi:predicted Fe-S protein YdhL (DUF1289 family)